jgi:hypothetical protein
MPIVTVPWGDIREAGAADSIYTCGLSSCIALAAIDRTNNQKILYHMGGGSVEFGGSDFTVLETFVNNHNEITIIIAYGINVGEPVSRERFLTEPRITHLLNNANVRQIVQATGESVMISNNSINIGSNVLNGGI